MWNRVSERFYRFFPDVPDVGAIEALKLTKYALDALSQPINDHANGVEPIKININYAENRRRHSTIE